MKAWILISLLILGLLSAACAPSTVVSTAYVGADPTADACKVAAEACGTLTPAADSDDLAMARAALMALFDALNEGEYAKAEALYGGGYEVLAAMNPAVDPNDGATLLENACTINGYQCLKVKNIVHETQTAPDCFAFTVEFMNVDGGLFGLGACCSGGATEAPPQTEFAYTVLKVGNAFRVQELPVYVP
jgi:hypothetical protein